MITVTCFAHSVADGDLARWEPLVDHCRRVAGLAAARAARFGAAEWGGAAGWLHDFGKVDARFQARLRGSKTPFDHAAPGAAVAQRTCGRAAALLAPVVAGHHTGLMDATEEGGGEQLIRPLDARLADAATALGGQLALARAAGLAIPDGLPAPPVRPRQATGEAAKLSAAFGAAFFTRMLYSALVDADFIATEGFYAETRGETIERGLHSATLRDLRARLDAYLAAKTRAAADRPGPVNAARARVLATVRARAGERQGLFTLTVPTGGGKTLASLAFALDHAIAHGLDRIIVVIPYTSIVEQTAEVFREAFADLADCVLEHHSAFDETRAAGERGAPEMLQKLKRAQENWDAPVVVTTAVQFFESLFHNKSSRCRKLHAIARSVVIVDEAQTVPLPVLRPVTLAIDELARNYRTSVVLSTATQPALVETADGKGFAGGLREVCELAPDPVQLFGVLRRVGIDFAGPLDDGALAARLAGSDRVLAIVNTRRHARKLFERIRRAEGARHLSTMMTAEHRATVFAGVRADLANGRPARVVSTSLIEAGVDIDFPLVLRAAAGLDQIAQAAGRCNREGRRDLAESRVVVFEPEGGAGHPEMEKRWGAARTVLRALDEGDIAGGPLDPPAIEAYFRELFWLKGEDALDEYGILALLRARAGTMQLPLESIARYFRMIDSAMVPLIVPRAEVARKAVDDLQHAEHVGGIARRLQRHVASIPAKDRGRLVARGAARVIRPEDFGDQFVVLTDIALYREDVGLDVSDPAFEEAGQLVV